jgi:hypothetical protein
LPASFVPFDLAHEVVRIDNAFAGNTDIRTASVRETIRPQPEQARYELLPLRSGRLALLICACSRLRRFEYDCSAPDGAVLVLPNGASQTDLSSDDRQRLLAYAIDQALSWLKCVYGSLDYADSLYLITGCDKCKNWCLASYSNMPGQIGAPLTFTPSVHQDDMAQYIAWSPAAIDTRTFSLDGQNHVNQSVFIRGYKISACKTLQEKLRQGPFKMSDIVSQSTENPTIDISGGVPGTNLLNWFLSQLTNFGKASGSNILDRLNDNGVQVDSFPGPPEV